MADLDDFFAKKDRKKTKSTKKFATPDELVKKLEDTTKKNEVKTARKEPQPSKQSTQEDGVEVETVEQPQPVEVCVSFLFISNPETQESAIIRSDQLELEYLCGGVFFFDSFGFQFRFDSE